MIDIKRYQIPAQPIEVVTEIKRSRFIARIAHCQNADEAFKIINQAKKDYPDARHHCWAFIACPPTSRVVVRFSDDGEPSGTAGKPILNVLSHSHFGEIVCVVSRYFGGIKLGAGGLVRAYSNSTQAALEQLSVIDKVELSSLSIQFPFSFEASVRHFLDSQGIEIINVTYSEQVILELAIEQESIESVLQQGKNLCKGNMIQLKSDKISV